MGVRRHGNGSGTSSGPRRSSGKSKSYRSRSANRDRQRQEQREEQPRSRRREPFERWRRQRRGRVLAVEVRAGDGGGLLYGQRIAQQKSTPQRSLWIVVAFPHGFLSAASSIGFSNGLSVASSGGPNGLSLLQWMFAGMFGGDPRWIFPSPSSGVQSSARVLAGRGARPGAYMYIYIYIYMYIHVCVYIYIYMCMYMYIYIYICTPLVVER